MSWTTGCGETKYEGIFKIPGGYRVRVRAVDPRSGTLKEANRKFKGISLEEALKKQTELRDQIRSAGSRGAQQDRRYGDFATSLFKRKIATGELGSAKSRERWADTQDLHLIPYFGDWYVKKIRRSDVEEWKATQGNKVKRGEYSPNTVNGWLAILLTTLRQAGVDLDLEYDATKGIKPLDTSAWSTYTEEEPGSLTVDEVPKFMAAARKLYPQHFGMLALGLATGRRPSELRPLRRSGATPDVLWDEGVLLVRRSETMGEVVETTKTGRRLRVPLPADLMDILRWHVARLPEAACESELLFPAVGGGYRAASVLDKPIRAIAEAAGITKHLTARFMRRTFQDLGRAAKVHDFVVRAISGHSTPDMQQHYSSVAGDEVREGLARVISLGQFKRVHDVSGGDLGGDRTAEPATTKGPETTKAA